MYVCLCVCVCLCQERALALMRGAMPAAAGLLAWDGATLAGSDAFWALVNPDGGELTVEILPPVRVALRPRRPPVPSTPPALEAAAETATALDNATAAMGELPDATEDVAPELAWERMVDRWRLEWLEWVRAAAPFWSLPGRDGGADLGMAACALGCAVVVILGGVDAAPNGAVTGTDGGAIPRGSAARHLCDRYTHGPDRLHLDSVLCHLANVAVHLSTPRRCRCAAAALFPRSAGCTGCG
jgi:hypothetical protein